MNISCMIPGPERVGLSIVGSRVSVKISAGPRVLLSHKQGANISIHIDKGLSLPASELVSFDRCPSWQRPIDVKE